jgi:hypothetical protein
MPKEKAKIKSGKHLTESKPVSEKDWLDAGTSEPTKPYSDAKQPGPEPDKSNAPYTGVAVETTVTIKLGDRDIVLTKTEAEQLRDILILEFPGKFQLPYTPYIPTPLSPWPNYPNPFIGDPVPGYPGTGIWYCTSGQSIPGAQLR